MASFVLLTASTLLLVLGANAQATDNVTWAIARQGYSAEDEASVNRLINNSFQQFYIYAQMHAFFLADPSDLDGFADFFERQANEEKEQAFKLIRYQTDRGTTVSFQAIPRPSQQNLADFPGAIAMNPSFQAPTTNDFGRGLDAFVSTLAGLKSSYDLYIAAYDVAVKGSDPDLAYEIEEVAHKKIREIKEVAQIVRDLQRANQGKPEGSLLEEYKIGNDLAKHEKERREKEDKKKCKKHDKEHGKHKKEEEDDD